MSLNMGDYRKDVGAVQIELIQNTTITTPECEGYHFEENSFWKRITTGEKRTKITTVEPAKTTVSTESVVFSPLLKILKEAPKDLEGWTEYKYTDYWGDSSGKRWYKVMPHTAEQLRDESIRCWKHYIKAQHTKALEEDRKRELSKVIGDYPPKSVKDLVNA